jgi:hypothetical protein
VLGEGFDGQAQAVGRAFALASHGDRDSGARAGCRRGGPVWGEMLQAPA